MRTINTKNITNKIIYPIVFVLNINVLQKSLRFNEENTKLYREKNQEIERNKIFNEMKIQNNTNQIQNIKNFSKTNKKITFPTLFP